MVATAALLSLFVVGIALLVTSVVAPFIGLAMIAVAFVPLAFMTAGRLFRHAAVPPGAHTHDRPAGHDPAVPSTSEASYDPVAKPEDR